MWNSHLSASLLVSRSPNSTLDTSRWGSQSVNPRPIRSIAALLRGVWLGIVSLGGASTKYIKALAVRRTSTVPRAGGSTLLPPARSCSRSKRAPRTPQRITAVVWFRRATTALGSPSSSGLGKNDGRAIPKQMIYNFKNLEIGGKSVVKKEAMMLRTAGQNCELVEI